MWTSRFAWKSRITSAPIVESGCSNIRKIWSVVEGTDFQRFAVSEDLKNRTIYIILLSNNV